MVIKAVVFVLYAMIHSVVFIVCFLEYRAEDAPTVFKISATLKHFISRNDESLCLLFGEVLDIRDRFSCIRVSE